MTDEKQGYAALKVDMANAYDRVELSFLEKVMLGMGFHEHWVKLIMTCITIRLVLQSYKMVMS